MRDVITFSQKEANQLLALLAEQLTTVDAMYRLLTDKHRATAQAVQQLLAAKFAAPDDPPAAGALDTPPEAT